MENRGILISGIGHLALILWVLLGDWLFAPRDMPPIPVASVSLVSETEFEALQASAPKAEVKPAPEPAAQPEPTPAPEQVVTEQPPPEPALEQAPAPETAPPPEPEPTPLPEVPAPQMPVILPTSALRPKPRPADRVAPTPVEAPPDVTEVAPEVTAATTDTPTPDAPVVVEEQTAAAPEEAGDVLRTEANKDVKDETFAPPTSGRPKPRPDAKPAEEVTPPEPPAPEEATDPASDAIAAALAEATAETSAPEDSGAQDVPLGPPVTAGEKDAFRVAVQQCWNVGSLSSEALRVTVTIGLSMGPDGVPDAASLHMVTYEGGSEGAAMQAYEAARRAILRCGARGFPLPPEKYDQWKEMELVFNPEGMRMR